jgi:hypothetical protein
MGEEEETIALKNCSLDDLVKTIWWLNGHLEDLNKNLNRTNLILSEINDKTEG